LIFSCAAGCRNRDSKALPDHSPPEGMHVTTYLCGHCRPGGGMESAIV